MEINILHEDQHIIVAVKPPKVPSQKDLSNDIDMLTILKKHIKKAYPNAKNPYIALIHRLDRPVGGVMIFAKTKYAAGKLSSQIKERTVEKTYLCIVCGKPNAENDILEHVLVKKSNNISEVVNNTHPKAKKAILEYNVIETKMTDNNNLLSLLKVKLMTGRHHQIRVQTAYEGWGIWGDTKYNKTFKNRKGWTQIALWAYQLTFKHPKTNKIVTFKADPIDIYPFTEFTYHTFT